MVWMVSIFFTVCFIFVDNGFFTDYAYAVVFQGESDRFPESRSNKDKERRTSAPYFFRLVFFSDNNLRLVSIYHDS